MVQEASATGAVISAVCATLTLAGAFLYLIFRIGREAQKIESNKESQNLFNSTCVDRLNEHGRLLENLTNKVNDIPAQIKDVQMDGLKEMHNAMSDAFKEIDGKYARKDVLDQLLRELNKK